MDDMNEIFSRATDADLDVEMAAAGELLQKIAEQEGIDLSQLSDEDVAELMVDLLPKTAADEGEHESAREESSEDRKEKKKKEEAKMASQITFADVAVELNKVAASEGIDLDALDRSEYHELFDIVAESMQDPEYMENKLAEDEANAKLAEADALGRYMAQAFMDEQAKIADKAVSAASHGDDAYAKHLETMAGIDKIEKAEAGKGRRVLPGGLAIENTTLKSRPAALKAQEESVRHMGSAGNVSGALKKRVEERLKNETIGQKAMKHVDRLGRRLGGASPSGRMLRGGAAIAGGTLAAGGAAYGAKRMMDKKSVDAAFEAQALSLAERFLVQSGVDIELSKVAAWADELDFNESALAGRAREILEENGYL